jgi:outer membrane protein TolC
VLPNNISTGANLSQMVYDTRFFIGIQTFKELIKVSKLTTALTEQEIRYNIIKGYYEVQAAKEILRVLDSNLVIVDKLLHDTKETYKAGLIEETDVDRLELGESMLKSQINNTRNLYDLGMSSLKYNMGLQISDKIALTDDIETLRKQISDLAAVTFDPSQRIESDLLQTSILLHDFDRKQKKAGYYPSIFLMGNFGGGSQVDKVADFFRKQDDGFGGKASNWFMQSYVGFTIRIPIYDGGQKEAAVKQAKIEIQKARNDFENFKTQSALQVEAARTTFATNLAEEQNAKESMRLNNKIFGKTQIKFKEGVSSSFELIQTEQEQTTNQIKYYTAVKNVLTSRADLDKALGIK